MSEKRSVLVTRKLPAAVEARIARDYDADLNPTDTLYSADELIARAEGKFAIIPCHTEKFTADVFARLPESVKAICNFSVGYDHVDTEAAKKKGVIVTNTPDVLSDATAEIALLLLLGAARRAGEGEMLVRNREWKDWSPAFMVGRQVTGKRLGILGMGRVGQVFATRAARGLDMEIHYHNRSRLDAATEAECKAAYVSKEDLLRQADHLVLVLPYTPQNHHAIGAAEIAMMKPTATLINIARGGIVDDAALAQALREKRIAAAGLDVFEGEPKVHPDLLTVPNVALTPHIASATIPTRMAMANLAADNLIGYLTQGKPVTPLNPEVLGS